MHLSTFTLALLVAGLTTVAKAAPMDSPLASLPDSLGRELQETFIAAPPDAAPGEPASFTGFRKRFTLPATPRSAVLHLFADARYLLWINGESVLRGPARFETRGPEYDAMDVARLLRAGANEMALVVMGNTAGNARMMRHSPGLTLRLDADGHPVVRTDDTWKCNGQTRYRPAFVDWANVRDRIDTRVEDGDWTQPGYDDAGWKSAVRISGDAWGPLSARRIPPLRDTPVDAAFADGAILPVTLAAGQKLKFSVGRLVQAYSVVTLEADAGTELSLDYAKIPYLAKPGRQTYVSSDTVAFDGGEITVKTGGVRILELRFVERLYPFDLVGSFRSSDPLLDRLWAVCARSLQVLSEDAYVDCADRERAEWMDNDPPDFDVTRTAMAAPGPDGQPRYADARLLGAMLRRTALTLQKDGWVKAHTTSDRFDIHAKMEDRGCDWVQGARRYYESTGDLTLIREIWPVIVRQMDYFLERRTPRGLVLAREWVAWGNPLGYVTTEGAGLNAFIYKALVDAASLGKAIGETPTATRLDQAARTLATAFNDVLWNEEEGTYFSGYAEAGRVQLDGAAKMLKIKKESDLLKIENERIAPTMFSALWALDQEIVPPARRARVMDYLFKHRGQAERIMAFYYLFRQMFAADTDAFDREIINSLRTKWAAQAESRWQTVWEEFKGGSKAHCYGMFPGYFMSARVLGVRPDLPVSNRRILIEPHLGDLLHAEGTVVTEFGPVPVSWRNDAGNYTFSVEVPTGTKALLRLPTRALVLDGKPVSGRVESPRFVVEVDSGQHQGTFSLP